MSLRGVKDGVQCNHLFTSVQGCETQRQTQESCFHVNLRVRCFQEWMSEEIVAHSGWTSPDENVQETRQMFLCCV